MPVTKVIFRVWNDTPDSVIALLPDEKFEPGYCMHYTHLGGRGGTHFTHTMSHTRPATPAEYADLKAELERLGYKLRIAERR